MVAGLVKDLTEARLRQASPFKIIFLTASATYAVAFLQNFLSGNEFSKKKELLHNFHLLIMSL